MTGGKDPFLAVLLTVALLHGAVGGGLIYWLREHAPSARASLQPPQESSSEVKMRRLAQALWVDTTLISEAPSTPAPASERFIPPPSAAPEKDEATVVEITPPRPTSSESAPKAPSLPQAPSPPQTPTLALTKPPSTPEKEAPTGSPAMSPTPTGHSKWEETWELPEIIEIPMDDPAPPPAAEPSRSLEPVEAPSALPSSPDPKESIKKPGAESQPIPSEPAADEEEPMLTASAPGLATAPPSSPLSSVSESPLPSLPPLLARPISPESISPPSRPSLTPMAAVESEASSSPPPS
ncbi:MAG: hypothetical protein AAGJ31_12850, partial [Verrucomicrobiota bacterium]